MSAGVRIPKAPYSLERLIQSWHAARHADERPRALRQRMVREYAGDYYGEAGLAEDRPVNLTAQYVNITVRSLVPKTPRFLLSTFDRAALAAVETAQRWGNEELERMRFAVTLRRVVYDALFPGGGVGRVALVDPMGAALKAWGPVAGEPCFSRIDPEDFACDPFAGEFQECSWQGHYFRVPLVVAREFKGFSAHRKDLEATPLTPYDEQGNARVGTISRGVAGDDEFEEMVGLWEFYIPRHRGVVTLMADAAGQPMLSPDGKPLGEKAFVGHETGPYELLGYQWVPGNVRPKGPVADVFPLDLAANQALRKFIGDIDSLKEIMVFSDAATAERFRNARSGSYEFADDPKAVQSVAFNGAQTNLSQGAFLLFKQMFDQMGGNLSLLGGLGPQAKTARQESMLNQNAGAGVADLSETTLRYTGDVLNKLLWYWWKHPHLIMDAESSAPGLPEYPVAERLHPRGSAAGQARDLPFDKLRLRVDPYSQQPSTPREILAELRDVVKNEVLPIMPLLEKHGVAFDAAEYLKMVGELLDNARVGQVTTLQEPPPGLAGEGQGGPSRLDGLGMPGSTEREYTRHNVSEATQGGQERNLMQQLMTGNSPGGAPGQPQPTGA